jgi:hypothetical protein
MNHNVIRQHLPDFVNRKLFEDVEKKILEHIQTCKDCTEEVEQLKIFFTSAKRENAWVPPEQYFVSVLPKIHQRIEKKRFFDVPQGILRLVLPMAALVVMVVFFLQLFPVPSTQRNTELQLLLQQMSVEELQQVDETVSSMTMNESQEMLQSEPALLVMYLTNGTLSVASVEYEVQDDLEYLSEEEVNHLLALLEE